MVSYSAVDLGMSLHLLHTVHEAVRVYMDPSKTANVSNLLVGVLIHHVCAVVYHLLIH
jgi:hypothetical protein